jgi:hypothetical protein
MHGISGVGIPLARPRLVTLRYDDRPSLCTHTSLLEVQELPSSAVTLAPHTNKLASCFLLSGIFRNDCCAIV